MRTITVKVPGPLAAWLTRQSRRLRRSKSSLIRQALEEQRSQSAKPSCLELMEDLCGTVRGPRDLSANPKHLDGFGQ